MKFTAAFVASFYAHQALGALRPDIKGEEVVELEPGQQVGPDTERLLTKMSPRSSIEFYFQCSEASGKRFVVSTDKKYVACCLPGQILAGSAETEMRCCGAGHYLAHSKETGAYSCCPEGQIFDGTVCKTCDPPPEVCKNGKKLVNGMCVCPDGTTDVDGWCKVPKQPGCTSGVQAGKCYTFSFENGFRFGYNNAGWYTASKESRNQQFGKFKLCKDADCTSSSAINPGEGFKIKDLHGQANGGQNPGHWLNNAQNGGHIGKTPDYNKAGSFTISKWPCGKYCLGGLDAGIGPTCPSEMPAATFTTFDKQSCIPIDLLEVPCDIHDVANNCIWKNGADQCCDKVDCGWTKTNYASAGAQQQKVL